MTNKAVNFFLLNTAKVSKEEQSYHVAQQKIAESLVLI
jgi:hypothetical protein